MNKADYVKFAAVIKGEVSLALQRKFVPQVTVILTLQNIMRSTADMFAADNPRFDRATFYLACGFDCNGFDVVR